MEKKKSLCDQCRLSAICSIRVLEREVGLPKHGLAGAKKERVLSCGYYARDQAEIAWKEHYRAQVAKLLWKSFPYLDVARMLSDLKLDEEV